MLSSHAPLKLGDLPFLFYNFKTKLDAVSIEEAFEMLLTQHFRSQYFLLGRMWLDQLQMAALIPDVSLPHFSPYKLKCFCCITTYLSSGMRNAIQHFVYILLSQINFLSLFINFFNKGTIYNFDKTNTHFFEAYPTNLIKTHISQKGSTSPASFSGQRHCISRIL